MPPSRVADPNASMTTLIRSVSGSKNEPDIMTDLMNIEKQNYFSEKMKSMRLEAELSRHESEASLAKLRKSLHKDEDLTEQDKHREGPMSVQDIEFAKALDEMDPVKRNRILGLMQMARSRPSGGSGGSDPSMGLMYMAMMMQDNNGGGRKDDGKDVVITTLGNMVTALMGNQMKPSDVVQMMNEMKKESGGDKKVSEQLNEVVFGVLKDAFKEQPDDLEQFLTKAKRLQEISGTGGMFGQNVEAIRLQLEQNENQWRREIGAEILKRKWDLEDKKLMIEGNKSARIEKGLRTVLDSVISAVVEETDETNAGGITQAAKKAPPPRQNIIEYECGDCSKIFQVAPDTVEAVCPGCGKKWDLSNTEVQEVETRTISEQPAVTQKGKVTITPVNTVKAGALPAPAKESEFALHKANKKEQSHSKYSSLMNSGA